MINISELNDKIRTRYPDISFTDNSEKKIMLLEFIGSHQSDYYYYVWVNSDNYLADVGAKLISQKDSYFWHTDLDYFIDSKDSVAIVEEFVFETLKILANHRTRIIQKKKLLSQTFILEFLDNNIWRKYCPRNGLRFSNLKFPKISGRTRIYE